MVKKVFFLAMLAVLSACQTATPEMPNYPAIHFTSQPPFALNVGNIQVVPEYNPPLSNPNVEHLSPITPSSSVRTWANDRLKASGRGKPLKVVIKDASIIEKPLPRTEGMKGVFTRDEEALYTGHLLVKLEIYGNDDPVFPSAEITADITRSKSVSEDASANERQAVLYELTKGMIEDLNREMEKNIQLYFGKYF